MAQRSLDFGVLFSLRELRVYRAGADATPEHLIAIITCSTHPARSR